MAKSAVFALCMRSTEAFLPGVLDNLERLAGACERSAFVFVEGDSTDQTKSMLKAWCAARTDATLIEMDGLAERIPMRTERLAACRNAYLDFIKASPLAAYDQLVMLDGDNVNAVPLDLASFVRAAAWLDEHDAAAVMANSQPYYYDLWALRHPTWCPGDYVADIEQNRKLLGKFKAEEQFYFDRNIPIPATAEPIEVQSAFGGYAIYRMADALTGRYVGRTDDGRPLCEHVSYNQDVRQGGRRMFILPWLLVGAPSITFKLFQDRRELTLTQSGRSCVLLAPADHPIDRLREAHPLFGRRFPRLARLTADAAPDSAAIEVGAGIGSAIALCRLEGAHLRFLAVEKALGRLKFLIANRDARPEVLGQVEPVWNVVGRATGGCEPTPLPGAPVASLQHVAETHHVPAGGLSLVKLDAGGLEPWILQQDAGFLSSERPVIWAEARSLTRDDEAAWEQVLLEAGETWPHVIAFDDRGFAIFAGSTVKKRRTVRDLMSYARRHTALADGQFGSAPIQHLDLALFPERFAEVFHTFRKELPELRGA